RLLRSKDCGEHYELPLSRSLTSSHGMAAFGSASAAANLRSSSALCHSGTGKSSSESGMLSHNSPINSNRCSIVSGIRKSCETCSGNCCDIVPPLLSIYRHTLPRLQITRIDDDGLPE